MTLDKKIYEHAQDLFASNADNVRVFTDMERVWKLDWKTLVNDQNKDWIMEVKDPQPFMAVRWLVEVMAGTEPLFRIRIPQEALSLQTSGYADKFRATLRRNLPDWVLRIFKQPDDAERVGSHLARLVANIIKQNDRYHAYTMLDNILTAAFVHGRMVVKLVDLRQNYQWQKQSYEPTEDLDYLLSDWSRIKCAPFSLSVEDAKTVHPEWDAFGLSAVLHRYLRPAKEVRDMYGLSLDEYQIDPAATVIFSEYWTRKRKLCWIEKIGDIDDKLFMSPSMSDDVIIVDERDKAYGFVPFAIRDPYQVKSLGEAEIIPLLYPGAQGRVFERQSLMLTVMMTIAFRMANPQWGQSNVPEGEEAIDLDFTQPNVYPLGPGQTLFSLNVPLNEYVMEALREMNEKAQASSVSQIIAGQRPGGVTAASALNILSQGNKLQIVPVEKSVRQLYTDIANMIFDAIRAYEKVDPNEAVIEMWTREGKIKVDPDVLPQYMDIEVAMEVAMPQDRAALINMAIGAWKSGAVTKRTALRWMGVDPDDEERQEEYEKAKGILPSLESLKGMSTQEGVLPQTPAANPVSGEHTPEDNRVQTNVGGG